MARDGLIQVSGLCREIARLIFSVFANSCLDIFAFRVKR